MRRWMFAWLAAVGAAFAPAATCAADGPTQGEIDAAIARGVAFLRREQDGRGGWSFRFNYNHELGITALAGLALLENGVEPTDKAIVSAEEVVKTLAKRSNQTYDLVLAILFLARIETSRNGPNNALIRRLAERLAGGGNGGIWTYEVPLVVEDEETGSVRLSTGSTPPSAPSSTPSSTPSPKRRKARRPRRPSQAGDNSNTQFALLGLWGAGRHGFDSNESLESIDDHFRSTQNSDGGWGYTPGGGRGSEAMACAGLMGLAIAAARPELAERQTARARGAALAVDPAFVAALRLVSNEARGINGASDIYYLWSLERVCVALGLRDLDGLDWYAAGAVELLRRQQGDGGWPDQRWGRLPNTCLALLFLRKANLAFEFDRVLRLPGPRDKAAEPVAPAEPAAEAKSDSNDDARVIVTGASDAGFPEIAVDFEVKRSDGSFLLDAVRDDFRVTEDGDPVKILRFQGPTTREARPITVVLVVDRSRSMEEEDRIGSLKRAVASFLKGLPDGSRVAVVAFGSEVEQICPFTGDFAKVGAAVDRLTPGGATRYYDAVAESLELIRQEPGQRAILALTDGEDTFSQTSTLDSLIVTARRLGLPIHTLGLGSEDEIESAALRKLAESTRGQYYAARQVDQLRLIYEQLAARLRAGYSLVYQSDRKIPDGTLRPVRVAYRASRTVGETAVFIPGMVVPAADWPRLFLALLGALALLAFVPGRLARQK